MCNLEAIIVGGMFLFALTATLCMTSHSIHEDKLLAEAIASGVDPVRAQCGFNPYTELCLINETKSK